MALLRDYGPPSLFVTITCNPNWPEIQDALAHGNFNSSERMDIVTRVWRLKLNGIRHDIVDNNALGVVVAFVLVRSSCYGSTL